MEKLFGNGFGLSTSLLSSKEFFVRPGGFNTLSRAIDKYAQQNIDFLEGKLKAVKIPIKDDGEGSLTHSAAISDFFKTLKLVDYTNTADPIYEKAFKDIIDKEKPESLRDLNGFIDSQNHASSFYEVKKMIEEDKLSLNAYVFLNKPFIAAYLFLKAIYSPSLELTDVAAIYKNMKEEVNDPGGVKEVYRFVLYNSIAQIKHENKIETGGETRLQALEKVLKRQAIISLGAGVFSEKILSYIKQDVFNKDELKLIEDNRDVLNINDEDIPYLLSYIKKSKIKIEPDNAQFYLSIALSNLKNNNLSYSSDKDEEIADFDFGVTYYDDVKTAQSYNKESILCAAQLYYVMTLGDELGIFDVVNTIMTKEMPKGRVDITSKQLMKDLQQYFFNENFSIGSDGTQYKRTLAEERHMFYKQVFDIGGGEIVDGAETNKEFNILWNTLLEEVVKYISKIERSNNPELFVSKQNIFQAIEDLQYNLSNYCTGMAKVATPIMNKELDFVVERFLMHEDIRKQLAPNGNGSFWKVIENVQRGKGMMNTSLLRNKAVFTHKIITAIANYTPLAFDNDKVTGEFVSTVEALIINNDQLENKSGLGNSQRDKENDNQQDWDNHAGDLVGGEIPSLNGSGGKDDWNF
jgi:hypothetical protein